MTDGHDGFGYGRRPAEGSYGPPVGGTSVPQPTGQPGWNPPTTASYEPPWQPAAPPIGPSDIAFDAPGRPPVGWLIAADVVGAAAAVLAWLLGAQWWAALLAWFLAGPVGIGLLAVYGRRDVVQRARFYTSPPSLPLLYGLTVVALVVGVLSGAWHLALLAGRL